MVVHCRCLGIHREQQWGLNTYLYAPKDDYKHRMYWRDLYSAEEASEFQSFTHPHGNHTSHLFSAYIYLLYTPVGHIKTTDKWIT